MTLTQSTTTTTRILLFVVVAAASAPIYNVVDSFVLGVGRTTSRSTQPRTSSLMMAEKKKPQRFDDNADGVVYVNDKCINCAACSMFAPQSFGRSMSANSEGEHWNGHHIVHTQPNTQAQIVEARAALAACPVAAIRIETLAERRHRATDKAAIEAGWTENDQELVRQMGLSEKSGYEKPFPRPLFDDDTTEVYWVGHHNDGSFGAVPYLFKTTTTVKNDDDKENTDDNNIWIMVDTPRFSKSAVDAVTSLTPDGPDYLFLTHVDDTADHNKWVEHFNGGDGGGDNNKKMKRIFHAGDLGVNNWLGDTTLENVEILLQQQQEKEQKDTDSDLLVAYNLHDGSVLPKDWESIDVSELPIVILHTPGHSAGSITLYKRPTTSSSSNENSSPGILFTGDSYAYRTSPDSHKDGDDGKKGHMTGFPRYNSNGHDRQVQSITKLLDLDWDVVCPGHGHPRDYRRTSSSNSKQQQQADEMKAAIDELMAAHEQRTGMAAVR